MSKAMGKVKKTLIGLVCIACVWIIAVVFASGCGGDGNDGKGNSGATEIVGVYAKDVEAEYDGREYGIKVENTKYGDKIYYKTSGETEWSETEKKFSDVGEYEILYKVERNGKVYESKAAIRIRKAVIKGISANNVEVVYDGKWHGIEIVGAEATDEVEYSSTGTEYTRDAVRVKEVGEYEIYYKVMRKGGEYRSSALVRIKPNIAGMYVEKRSGVIELTTEYAEIAGEMYEIEYGVDGEGEIKSKGKIKVTEQGMEFAGKEYKKVKTNENVYEISTEQNGKAYIIGGEQEVIGIKRKETGMIIVNGEREIESVDNVNYCENAEKRNYVDGSAEITITATGKVTPVRVDLSQRKQPIGTEKERTRIEVCDGKDYGYAQEQAGKEVLYKVNGEYTDAMPKENAEGEYEIDCVEIEDGFLPKIMTYKLIIAKDISGTYYNDSEIVVIAGKTIKKNGATQAMTYSNGVWQSDGQAIHKTPDKLTIGTTEYAEQTSGTKLIAVTMFEQKKVIQTQATSLTIRYADGAVQICDYDGTEIYRAEAATDIASVTANGQAMTRIGTNNAFYVLGMTELADIIIEVVIVLAAR